MLIAQIPEEEVISLDDFYPIVLGIQLTPTQPSKSGPFRAILGPDWCFSPRYTPYEGQEGDLCVLALQDLEATPGDKLTWALVVRKLGTPLSLHGYGPTLHEAIESICADLEDLADATSWLQLHLFTLANARV